MFCTLLYHCLFQIKYNRMSQFLKVFTRKVNKAAVKTDKAEEKLLDDEQYVPPPGHIGLLKTLISNSHGGTAQFVSLGVKNGGSQDLEPYQ